MADNLRVLVCCATSAVTSTLMMERIKKICQAAGLNVEVYKCIGQELKAKVQLYSPKVVVSTLQVRTDLGVPMLSGIPYLTNIGASELDQKILDILKSEQDA